MKRFFVMTLIGIMTFGISGNVYAGDETIAEKISKGGTDEKALNELETWADEVVEQRKMALYRMSCARYLKKILLKRFLFLMKWSLTIRLEELTG